jgi:magnesium transporter
MAYGPDGVVEEAIEDLGRVRQIVGAHPVTWINVDGLGAADPVRQLGEMFGLHRLALEDVMNVSQRAKVETYGDTVFLVARMVSLGERLQTEQISMFLGGNFVLTFQEKHGDCFDPVRERIRKGGGRIRSRGPDYLVYALLDAVIDHYFPVLEEYGERLETLEGRILTDPDEHIPGKVLAAKRDLLALRRAIWPHREAVNSLLREPVTLVTDSTRTYLRDCYDHAVQIIDMLESHREHASSLMDLHLAGVSNRMNDVMKVLTIIATVFIPLSFIAGLYGMNFDPDASAWNMPELGWRYGYPAALALMAAMAGGMFWYFRRKGWLGRRPGGGADGDG